MHAYLRLLTIFYRNAIINELEYRLNLWSRLLLSLFWLGWSAVGVSVFYVHVDRIAGWSYYELLVVLGMFVITNGFRQLVLEPNLSQMTEYVRMGTLDYILTKPVNSQFMVSLRNLNIFSLNEPLLGAGLIGYSLWHLRHLPSPAAFALFGLLTIAALLVLYSLNLLLQTLTFWLVNLENADALVGSVVEAGRLPVAFYGGWVRWALTAFIPVAFVTTFPAEALLGRLDGRIAVVAVVLAALLLLAATTFWNVALRSYTSASS
ncbi:MAG: ABC-2 family transporter protein [Herpetosiphonaceae bacterium]|nr:ABC-2 family transporter protein [Herpetosiphonaceae bacterium]